MLLSEATIDLFYKIKQDHPKAQWFAYYLEYLTFHLPKGMLTPSLEWLVRNGLTGQRFLDYIEHDCKRSGLELVRHMTMRVRHERKLRKLYIKDVTYE